MQKFRRVVNAALAARLEPSCTHSNNLPSRWGALPRRCGQRRRILGLGEVQYSNTQPIVVGCLRACSCCCLHVVPNSSKPGPHGLRLVLYKICFTRGGQHSRAAGRRFQGAAENVLFAHAGASVSTLLLYALGFCWRAVQEHVLCKKHGWLFFSARSSFNAATSASAQLFSFSFERQHHRALFFSWQFFIFSFTDCLIVVFFFFFPPRSRPCDFLLFSFTY